MSRHRYVITCIGGERSVPCGNSITSVKEEKEVVIYGRRLLNEDDHLWVMDGDVAVFVIPTQRLVHVRVDG